MRWPHSTLKFLSWSEIFNVGFTVTAPSVCLLLVIWVHVGHSCGVYTTLQSSSRSLPSCQLMLNVTELLANRSSAVHLPSFAVTPRTQCYIQHFGFYQLYVVTLALPMALLGLCVALNRTATWLEARTAHPREGGWLLRWLPQSRRTWWHDWATGLRTRHDPIAPYRRARQ